MNPLRWSAEHKLAWLMFTLLGAIISVFVGFMFFEESNPWRRTASMFAIYIVYPAAYWHWALFGALVAGIGFYAIRLVSLDPDCGRH